MTTPIDLRQLAVERSSREQPSPIRRRAWLSRWGLPLAIVVGFLALIGWSARDQWLPAKPVTIVPVILTRSEEQQAGTPLFRAAGWIEPRPTAVTAAALVEGVVEELLVVEGQSVQQGEPVARLLDVDARIALQEAEAALQLQKAERDGIEATLTAAQQTLEQPVHLEAALADAEIALAELESRIQSLPFALKAAQSRLQLARQDLEGKQRGGDAVTARSLQRSQSELDAATTAVDETRAQASGLEEQREACRRKRDALRSRLSLKTDEHRAVDEARANLAAAEARLVQARLGVETARLRLDRMVVRSPITGRVLSLHAQPGQRLMGLNMASERDASTVVTLYDPTQLQIRVDVRLEDVPQVQIGQPVQISTAAAAQPLTGRVLVTTSQADIQKNTLSVKVSIDNAPPTLRPEMLAEVTFRALQQPEDHSPGQRATLRMFVARELVEAGEGGSWIWVADLKEGVARRRTVELGRARSGDLVEVTQGLSAFDKLIATGRAGLYDGNRIRVAGEDRSLGTGQYRPLATTDRAEGTAETATE